MGLRAQAWLIDVLAFQGIEVHVATRPLVAGDRTYPAGSFVILAPQPQRPNVLALLRPQAYPPRFQYPGGPAEQPYDIAGWTLPLQMGVQVEEVVEPIDTSALVRVDGAPPVRGRVIRGSAGYGYAFGPEMNHAAIARNRLLAAGYRMLEADAPLPVEGTVLPPCTTVVEQGDGLDAMVAELAWELGLSFHALESAPVVAARVLKGIGRDQSYVPGSILRVTVDSRHPIGHGLPAEAYAYFVQSPAFEPTGEVRVVASWPASDLLASGWLHGEALLVGRAALVDAPLGRGRVILAGFRLQHRGQPHSTFKVLFNSISYAGSQPAN